MVQILKKIRENLSNRVKAWKIKEQYFDYFDINRYTASICQDNKIFQEYTKKRCCSATFVPSSRSDIISKKATEKNVKNYIYELSNLRSNDQIQCSDIDMLAVAATMDEIDYHYACAWMICPTSINSIENRILKADDEKVLIRIVNSLVYKFNIDPYKTEDRLRSLYRQDEIRSLNKSRRYAKRLRYKLLERRCCI